MKSVLAIFVRLWCTSVGSILGYYLSSLVSSSSYSLCTGAWVGGLLFFLFSVLFYEPISRRVIMLESELLKNPVLDILFGVLGLILGLLLASFIQQPLYKLPIPGLSMLFSVMISSLLGYLGFRVGYTKREELISVFRALFNPKEGRNKKYKSSCPKILDTSVIIDGRIADICNTGFLEGELVIPRFVLIELQHIADSDDLLKRNRGRRGLDILNRVQKELPGVTVSIYDGDFEEVPEVDSKLIKLAQKIKGKVVTNDFNLNKICELQGVEVLNINDLSNSVKPIVLPGEELAVQVVKIGKEQNQGIAYLDDGTMIVVEKGQNALGEKRDVIVTSVLQTSAGRMVFAKLKVEAAST